VLLNAGRVINILNNLMAVRKKNYNIEKKHH